MTRHRVPCDYASKQNPPRMAGLHSRGVWEGYCDAPVSSHDPSGTSSAIFRLGGYTESATGDCALIGGLMSVENLANPANVLVRMGEAAPEACYFCGNPLTSPCVHWQCAGGPLTLHPHCAKELGIKLIFDCERESWLARGKSLDDGIDATLIGGGDV